MSEHIISASNVTHEHGPFITIGTIRIRRDFIGFYQYGMRKDEKETEHHYVYVSFVGSVNSFFTEFDTKELAEKEIARLDWIFSGLYKENKK